MTIDRTSKTWLALKAWAEDQIRSSRAELESMGTSPDMTAFHRGRITALRGLLAQGADGPEIVATSNFYL